MSESPILRQIRQDKDLFLQMHVNIQANLIRELSSLCVIPPVNLLQWAEKSKAENAEAHP